MPPLREGSVVCLDNTMLLRYEHMMVGRLSVSRNISNLNVLFDTHASAAGPVLKNLPVVCLSGSALISS